MSKVASDAQAVTATEKRIARKSESTARQQPMYGLD